MRYVFLLILLIGCGQDDSVQEEPKATVVEQEEKKEPVVFEEVEEVEEVLIVSEEIESQAVKYLLQEDDCQEGYINYEDIQEVEEDYDIYIKHLDWILEESDLMELDSILTPEGQKWRTERGLANEGYIISKGLVPGDENKQYNFCISR